MQRNRSSKMWKSFIVFILGLAIFMGLVSQTQAHQGTGIRYVAPHGFDMENCDQPSQPCRTIEYALTHANKADEVRVAGGVYVFDDTYLEWLFDPIVTVRGGYADNGHFDQWDPGNHPSYLVGVSQEYNDLLTLIGFYPVADAKQSGPTADPLADPVVLSEEAALPRLETAASNGNNPACTDRWGNTYECSGINLLHRMYLGNFSLTTNGGRDIWGHADLNNNREYAIITFIHGTAVVDVTDPKNPVEIGAFPGGKASARDVKVYQFYNEAQGRWNAYAYVVADGIDEGLKIIDLNDLPNSVSVAATYTGFQQAHNIYIGNVEYQYNTVKTGFKPYAYILGSNLNGGSYRILDLSNPTAPVEVGHAPSGKQRYAHDGASMIITDGRTSACAAGHNPCEIYFGFNGSRLEIWDVTDKSSPYLIEDYTGFTNRGYIHSGWVSKDTKYLFVQDEFDENKFGNNSRIRTLDISDLENPFVSNVWEGSTSASDHNGFAKGDRYYIANYKRGLTVLDISDPNAPTEIGFFDTYRPSNNASFNGAWGVYPFLPSGTILISDISYGLSILEEDETLGKNTLDKYKVYMPFVVK